MFSTPDFIEASRSFVCVRIETYENEENEELIRSILNGVYANTAFCIFDPQGKRRLSRSGRSPGQVLGGRDKFDNDDIIDEMFRIAKRYPVAENQQNAGLQDFLSFTQALNVASADQRLLVFVNADSPAIEEVSPVLEKLFSDEEIIGRFHLDLAGEGDKDWGDSINGSTSNPAINVIRSGKYGQDGTIVSELSLDSTLEEIKAALLADNEKFAKSEQRKTYNLHVRQGKRQGIEAQTEIPYGEDRDADGEIDQRPGRGDRGGNNGERRGREGGPRAEGKPSGARPGGGRNERRPRRGR